MNDAGCSTAADRPMTATSTTARRPTSTSTATSSASSTAYSTSRRSPISNRSRRRSSNDTRSSPSSSTWRSSRRWSKIVAGRPCIVGRLARTTLLAFACVHFVLAVNSASEMMRGFSTSIKRDDTVYYGNGERMLTTLLPNIGNPCYEFIAENPEHGKFTTPNYPSAYPPNLRCVRTIPAPPGYNVELTFMGAVFEVEPEYRPDTERERKAPIAADGHTLCPSDYVEIRDGMYGFSPLIGRFCQITHPHGSITARWIYFHTDAKLEYAGFVAFYKFVHKGEDEISSMRLPATPCRIVAQPVDNGQLSASASMRQFQLDHRLEGDDPIDCVWIIRALPRMQLRIVPTLFQLGAPNSCPDNFVQIYAGRTAGQPMKNFCGGQALQVRTGWETAYVRVFSLARHLHKLKVDMMYTSYASSKNCTELGLFSCGDDTCVPHSLVCNGQGNCLYAKDEEDCQQGTSSSPRMRLHGPYLVILVIICCIIVSIIVCALILNCCPTCKRRQLKYEEMRLQQTREAVSVAKSNHTGKSSVANSVSSRTRAPLPSSSTFEDDSDGSLELRRPLDDGADVHVPPWYPRHNPSSAAVHKFPLELALHDAPSSSYRHESRVLSSRAQHARPPPAPVITTMHNSGDARSAFHDPRSAMHAERHPHPALHRRYLQQTNIVDPHTRPRRLLDYDVDAVGRNDRSAFAPVAATMSNGRMPNKHGVMMTQARSVAHMISPRSRRKMVTFGATEASSIDDDMYMPRESIASSSEPNDLSRLTHAYQDEREAELLEMQLRHSPLWQSTERGAHQHHQQRRPIVLRRVNNTPHTRVIIPHGSLALPRGYDAVQYSQDDSDIDVLSPTTSPPDYTTSIVTRI